MKSTVSNNSRIEKAIEILAAAGDKMAINDLIFQVFAADGVNDVAVEDNSSLYLDIVTSGEFVYLGDSFIDLKTRYDLAQYDKECSDFYPDTDLEDDDDIVIDDEELDLANEDDDEDDEEFDLEMDYDLSANEDDDYDQNPDDKYFKPLDEDEDFDDDDYNEDTYNRYMDDFEDMYDK